jgi:hypothetical protein
VNVPGRSRRGSVDDFERQLLDQLAALAEAQADRALAEADLKDLAGQVVDEFGGVMPASEYDRRRADAERRLVAATRQVEHVTAVIAGLRARGCDAVHADTASREAREIGKRERIEAERRGLEAQIARLNQADAKSAKRLAEIADERLPMLARFDPAAAEALKQREHARQNEAIQLARARLRGEDPFVPDELVALVEEVAPGVRAHDEARARQGREGLLRVGYLPLDQFEQPSDGAPVRRRGLDVPDFGEE